MRQLRPITTTVDLSNRQARIDVVSRVKRADEYILVVDMYSYLREKHPDTHIGFWVFEAPPGNQNFSIDVDLTEIGPNSVRLVVGGGGQAPVDSWTNPGYSWDPIVGIQLVRRLRSTNTVVESHVVTGKVPTTEVLKEHYGHIHLDHGYTPATHEPFLWRLHARVLRQLEKTFLSYIPQGGRVLDAGCGRSLFTEIRPDWPFTVVAADVEEPLIRQRRAAFPAHHWAVGSALPLPFRSQAFDALFAGELIEHLSDPADALAEFRRVLRPGGILILTTPNRRRLANVVDGSDRPISPDHLSELSYDELHELLRSSGFVVRRSSGLHLELMINWLSPLPKLDRLQRQWNRSWAIPLMEILFSAGRLFPRFSVDMMFVASRSEVS